MLRIGTGKSSTIGVTIDKWGPSAWNTLHAFAHRVPRTLSEEESGDFADFLHLFAKHLPCPECRRHFQEYLNVHIQKDSFLTRESTVLFMHRAHNHVNERLGKPQWSLQDHYKAYAVSAPQDHRPEKIVAIFACIMLLGAVYYRKKRIHRS